MMNYGIPFEDDGDEPEMSVVEAVYVPGSFNVDGVINHTVMRRDLLVDGSTKEALHKSNLKSRSEAQALAESLNNMEKLRQEAVKKTMPENNYGDWGAF